MITSSTVLEAAFAKVCQHTDAEPGIPVSFIAIAQEWCGAGMRMSDLRDAVRELIERGHALGREQNGHFAVELTQSGWERLQHK